MKLQQLFWPWFGAGERKRRASPRSNGWRTEAKLRRHGGYDIGTKNRGTEHVRGDGPGFPADGTAHASTFEKDGDQPDFAKLSFDELNEE